MRTKALLLTVLLALAGCGVQNPPTGQYANPGPTATPVGQPLTIYEQSEPNVTEVEFAISNPVETSLPYDGGASPTPAPRFLMVDVNVTTKTGEFYFTLADFSLVTASGTRIQPVDAVNPGTLTQGTNPNGAKLLHGQIAFELTEPAAGGRIELRPFHYPNETRVYVWTLGGASATSQASTAAAAVKAGQQLTLTGSDTTAEITLRNVTYGAQMKDSFTKPRRGQYIAADVIVTVKTGRLTISSQDFELVAVDGTVYDSTLALDGNDLANSDLTPGQETGGRIWFDVPLNAQNGARITLKDPAAGDVGHWTL